MLIFPCEIELNFHYFVKKLMTVFWFFQSCVLKLYMLHCKDNTRLNCCQFDWHFIKTTSVVHCSYGNSFKIIIEFGGNTKLINILYRQHSTEKKALQLVMHFIFFLTYVSILGNTHFPSWLFILLCGTDFTYLNMSKIIQIFLNQFNLELHTERICFVLRFFLCVHATVCSFL